MVVKRSSALCSPTLTAHPNECGLHTLKHTHTHIRSHRHGLNKHTARRCMFVWHTHTLLGALRNKKRPTRTDDIYGHEGRGACWTGGRTSQSHRLPNTDASDTRRIKAHTTSTRRRHADDTTNCCKSHTKMFYQQIAAADSILEFTIQLQCCHIFKKKWFKIFPDISRFRHLLNRNPN